MKFVNFLNLTNGIHFVGTVDNPHFCRIQSTWGEQKLWGNILQDLDYDLLYHLSQDYVIHLYYVSSKKQMSRALYQCVPFILFTLSIEWNGTYPDKVFVKNNNIVKYFTDIYKLSLNYNHLCKIRYFRKFIPDGRKLSLKIVPYCVTKNEKTIITRG